jgi:hypothetical protein
MVSGISAAQFFDFRLSGRENKCLANFNKTGMQAKATQKAWPP